MIHYIPFGQDCGLSYILRYADLRKESLPFDWTLGYPEHIKRSLDLKFSDWFSDFTIAPSGLAAKDGLLEGLERYTTKHINYPMKKEAKGLGFIAHQNFSDETTVLSVKKRINRFYEILESDDDIVFFSSIPYEELKKYGLLDYFKRNGKTTFLLLDISRSSNNETYLDYINGHPIIKAQATHYMDHECFKRIADFIKTLKL